MKFYIKHKEFFGFLTFILVIISTSAIFIFRACDKRSSKPNFEITYNFEYLESISGTWVYDYLQNTPIDKIFIDLNVNEKGAQATANTSFLISATIINKSTGYHTIKKIEIDNILIDNPDFDFKTKELPILMVSDDFEYLKKSTIVNFGEEKTQSIHIVVSIPFIYFKTEHQKSLGKQNKIFENSRITFDLVFYDENNKTHKLKGISIKKLDLMKFNILNKDIVG